MEEEIYTLVYYWNIPVKVWGVTSYFTNWGTDFQFSFKSPKGKMDAHAKMFKTMVKSFRPNLKWYNRYQQLVTMLIQRQVRSIRSMGELGSYIVSEQKLGIFSKVKEGENYNHRNTLSISRIII